jgi:penicillin-binding protein 2
MTNRVTWLRIALGIALLALVARLVQLQLVRGAHYRALSAENRLRIIREHAPRGMILDRAGRVLATNRLRYDVVVAPERIASARRAFVVGRLARLLELPTPVVSERLAAPHPPYEPVLIAADVDRDTIARVGESALTLPGVEIVSRPVRRYPRGTLAAHVLGYVREISSRELERRADDDYRPGDMIGKAGLERRWESLLRGADGGEQVEVDRAGRPVRVIGRQEPVPGHNLVLTIDARVQAAAEEALRGRTGAVVVMDPRNGDIIALASAPTFDPNLFTHRLTEQEWSALKGPGKPQSNRATAGLYQPGSVFKVVTALAALEAGKTNAGDRFYCRGQITIADHVFHCWLRSGHGAISFLQGFANSCNVMFMNLGRRVGPQRMAALARALGMGQPTGIDIAEERAGLVGDADWRRRQGRRRWSVGDTCQMAIGQGDLLITPLQAARLMAAVANGGRLVTPRLRKEDPVRDLPLDLGGASLDLVRRGLRQVVETGTGRAARDRDLAIAGKTGTAQNPHGPAHAWFVGYAPADDPRLVIAVLIERGGGGGAVAAPLARTILRAALVPSPAQPAEDRPRAARADTTAPPTRATGVVAR